MCGIAGVLENQGLPTSELASQLALMNELQAHRGPDSAGIWCHPSGKLGFAHRRLEIIDLEHGQQPMTGPCGNTVCYNGEIYNYRELRAQLSDYPFATESDTEVILAAYQKWGEECVNHFRGMFAFALWDEKRESLFCARDRFGIKPFYFAHVGGAFYFASEIKALLPFLPEIATETEALREYFVFQFCMGTKTLFKGVDQLAPAHSLMLSNGRLRTRKYWEVFYHIDYEHSANYFEEQLRELLFDSIRFHTRSDVPIGAYVSGGIDSGIVASVASGYQKEISRDLMGFTGRFADGPEFDESHYAKAITDSVGVELKQLTITSQDFVDSIANVIYQLDYPVAGPGSFPQYHVSRLVSKDRKVVLGGQGGDEIFGGYTRYLIAYFEQCIKAAIDGTAHNGNFVVTYESIIPNLVALKSYKPLLKQFWKQGLFESLDRRYYHLINRAPSLEKEVRWNELGDTDPFDAFQSVFFGENVDKESYFDSMTHFDFKTLLPALLHVEDRMSMAHGVEARVPFLDHPLVEFAATIPSDVKFKNGTLKKLLIHTMRDVLPQQVVDRTDKMGFPVPLNQWLKGELRDFVRDTFSTQRSKHRPFFRTDEILRSVENESTFGRKIWGLLSLELWHQQFHDKAAYYKSLKSGRRHVDEASVSRLARMKDQSLIN